ncbi:MAG TPA: L,D-transpeptidase family protein [Xanthobacteraceae bacterium]|nr:L,D-transpeptidase family protein [Xanthobacteraceae bacterium]
MRRTTLPQIRVKARPAQPTQGVLRCGPLQTRVALGRGGIRANKFEGDGATPRGRFHLLRLWWRPDRGPRPQTLLPIHRIGPTIAWCEDPAQRRYNQAIRINDAQAPGDRLWRQDNLYDLIIEIDHNTRPRIRRRGSAVFIHVARPGFSPTAGCVALAAPALRRLLRQLGPKTSIVIY